MKSAATVSGYALTQINTAKDGKNSGTSRDLQGYLPVKFGKSEKVPES
jgi:hypothetical protein